MIRCSASYGQNITELSFPDMLCDQFADPETAQEQKITKIGSVTLEVGEVSGIMTDLFVDCWNYFKVKHPVLAESELRLVTIPAVTFCGNCGKTYETVRYGKECPYCHSGETWLVDGNQCVIKEIEAECEEYEDK